MEKRAFLAITLSILVIIVYPYIIAKLYPPAQQPAQIEEPRPPIIKIKEFEENKTTNLEEIEEKWDYKTTNTTITISNLGGNIKQFRLNKYKDLFTAQPIELLENTDNPEAGILNLEFLSQGPHLPVGIYQRDGNIYRLNLDGEIEIIKEFRLDNERYLVELELLIKNNSAVPREIAYDIIGSTRMKRDALGGERFNEAYIFMGGKLRRISLYGNLSPKRYQGETGWVAQKNKYFCILLKPHNKTIGSFINPFGNNKLQIGCRMPSIRLEPDSQIRHRFDLYAGPLDYQLLKSIGGQSEKAVGLGSVSLLLLDILKVMQKLFHNYGIAIMLLTLLVSLILYPFTLKSLKSMKKIQELQPKIDKLRIEYKGNPHRLNKELLELYKKNRVNPLGGCLPIILQMPIFIALYNALSKSIELRGARFLWIKDLSSPDSAFRGINILPILMTVAMIIQQKISQVTPATTIQKEQKAIMAIMPIMFGVICYNLPSGLVLYWLTNTILMIACYGFIKKSPLQ